MPVYPASTAPKAGTRIEDDPDAPCRFRVRCAQCGHIIARALPWSAACSRQDQHDAMHATASAGLPQ